MGAVVSSSHVLCLFFLRGGLLGLLTPFPCSSMVLLPLESALHKLFQCESFPQAAVLHELSHCGSFHSMKTSGTDSSSMGPLWAHLPLSCHGERGQPASPWPSLWAAISAPAPATPPPLLLPWPWCLQRCFSHVFSLLSGWSSQSVSSPHFINNLSPRCCHCHWWVWPGPAVGPSQSWLLFAFLDSFLQLLLEATPVASSLLWKPFHTNQTHVLTCQMWGCVLGVTLNFCSYSWRFLN